MTHAVEQKAARFRKLHEQDGIFVVPYPWNVGTARILAALGFEALATTLAGLAFDLGRADGEAAVSGDETLSNARQIVEATQLPVTADLENGFADDPHGVAHTIRLAADVGLVGGSIEDATYNANAPLYDHGHTVERVAAAVRIVGIRDMLILLANWTPWD